jgi:hypothetical protein
MSLTRDAIFAADDHKKVEVQCPEWGGSVFVRTMNGAERDAFELDQLANPKIHLRVRLVAYTACDEAGKLIFSPNDLAELDKKNSKPLDRLFFESVKLNKISKQDIDELKND